MRCFNMFKKIMLSKHIRVIFTYYTSNTLMNLLPKWHCALQTWTVLARRQPKHTLVDFGLQANICT